jgi:hypothetical protein
MLGLLLDNIIVYLFRTVRRLIGERRSNVAGCGRESVIRFPRFGPLSPRGRYFKDSAKDYADRFAPSTDLNVRYNPQAPAVSIVRRQDQRLPP